MNAETYKYPESDWHPDLQTFLIEARHEKDDGTLRLICGGVADGSGVKRYAAAKGRAITKVMVYRFDKPDMRWDRYPDGSWHYQDLR